MHDGAVLRMLASAANRSRGWECRVDMRTGWGEACSCYRDIKVTCCVLDAELSQGVRAVLEKVSSEGRTATQAVSEAPQE